jgi:Pyruvate/2-oxoacid:ferredoxin oxidoreductase gamma subunit
MERELLFSGLGGQGIQLPGRTLGRAALLEDRAVLVFGAYGGEMRSCDTDVTGRGV